METSDWKVLTCPKCGNLVKVARSTQAQRVACPTCRHALPVAVKTLEPSTSPAEGPKTQLPTSRAFNPEPVKVRGGSKENWENQAPDLRALEFKDRLTKTTEVAAENAAEPPRKRKRVTRKHFKHKNLTSWEDGRSETVGVWQGLKRFLRQVPWGIVIVILLLLAGVIYKVMHMRQTQYAVDYERVEIPPPPPPKAELELAPKASILAALKPTLKSFLEAKSSVELRPLVRHPETVIPLMDRYYQNQGGFTPAEFRAMPDFTNLFVHKNFVAISLETMAYEPYTLTLEKTPEGYRVDWESYVGYGEMTLTQLRTERPHTPVLMRFILDRDNYYNFDFNDSQSHQCYKLRSKGTDTILYGYIPRNASLHDRMSVSLLNKTNSYCVLKVRYPESSTTADQVEIVEYLQTGWVMRGEDFELPQSSLDSSAFPTEQPNAATPP
jgi:DNA-directed RNA polymerase subunit M/transcription elongation factor TFIIS